MPRPLLLGSADEPEALALLGERPIHTIILTGFIRDNGIESPLNRGSFYGYRGADGKLEGVALIGHSTLMEVRSEAALGPSQLSQSWLRIGQLLPLHPFAAS